MTQPSSLDLKIQYVPPQQLKPYERNARRHSKRQIDQIASSIRRFGFTNPVLISDGLEIVAGHGRVEAAKKLGLASVPTVRLSRMSEEERRAYILADNKLALNAGWDQELLATELQFLVDLNFDVEVTGFSLAEIDLVLDQASDSRAAGSDAPEDEVPRLGGPSVTRKGDVWILGRHRLHCGDARDEGAYRAVLGGRAANLIFCDPPYNVPVDGHVCGLGRIRHREFAMGVGEMTRAEFTDFLATTLGHGTRFCADGSIAFVCMDWRHVEELSVAGRRVFSELKNICVWNKTNGGMGTFYRSKHELVFVFKVGTAPHVNSFGLGDTGRYRSNVWDYVGVNSHRQGRLEELEMHPTAKPVALIADAIRDCSKRGQLVLDMFGGSGSTLIAAEKTGRSAALIEFDEIYCDTTIARFERLTGKIAVLESSGESFEAVQERRGAHNTEEPLA